MRSPTRQAVLLILTLVVVAFAGCAATDPPPTSESRDTRISLGSWQTMRSEILDEDRELAVYLPNGYDPDDKKRYPLFVLLDGRMNFKATASTIHTLSEGGAIPRMIVVGIANTDRWRDLTPVEGMGIPGTGGGEPFLDVVATEILPYIDENWKTNGFRVFSGHSLGGLMMFHALVDKPGLFDAYLALSPSLEWADGFMVDRTREFLAGPDVPEAMVYMALADERLERLYFDPMVALFETRAPSRLIWTSELFEENDDHMSTRVTAGLAGLRWVFRDWRLTSNRIYAMTLPQIEDHYAMATRRYKEPRVLSMWEITDAGYWGLYDDATVDRAMAFFELAIEKWPDHPYPYSCLGEGLERMGRLEEALEQMKRALRMAEENGVRDLPYYQGMVKRVTAAPEKPF